MLGTYASMLGLHVHCSLVKISVLMHGHVCFRHCLLHRHPASTPRKQLFGDVQREQYVDNGHVNIHERVDSLDCSNFVDLDWLSSSGYSEESCER